MQEHSITPQNSLQNEQGKDTIISPQFDDSLLIPETYINHVDELSKESEPIPHTQILGELIEKVGRVDFRELAELAEKEQLKASHYRITIVEEILRLSIQHHWGICQQHNFIYLYNGAFWSLLDTKELRTFLGEAAEKMGVPWEKARDYNFRKQMFDQFIELANLPKPEQPKNIVLVNLKNGTLEITPQGTKLRVFNRADFITYQLPFEYNPEAKAPMFENYLNRVLPDKKKQCILQEYLGYVFIPPTTLKLEKTLLLYGTGANGKSVFYEIVRKLLGEQNTSEYSLQNLTNDNGYSRAMIGNKLVNYASEISGKLEASIFKQLVSGEPVEARLPYGNPFILTQYAKLIFNCNELPKDVEHTLAYFRRFLIVEFDVTIPEAEQDKQLPQKIITNELSGVLNWVLQGLNRLLEQKDFTDCEAVRIARDTYERQSDSVKLFIDETGYQASPTDYKLIKEFYHEYRVFCIDDGSIPVKKINFIKRLQGSGIVVERKNIGNVALITKAGESF